MAHDIIICGGAGEVTGEKTIKIYTHTRADIAIRVSTAGLDSVKHAQLEKLVKDQVKKLRKGIERITGDEYYYHQPHAENF